MLWKLKWWFTGEVSKVVEETNGVSDLVGKILISSVMLVLFGVATLWAVNQPFPEQTVVFAGVGMVLIGSTVLATELGALVVYWRERTATPMLQEVSN